MGVSATATAVVQGGEVDPFPTELLFDPLMAVQTDLDRIGGIGRNLDETWPKLSILQIDVVVFDIDRLTRKEKSDRFALLILAGLETVDPFLGHANEDDPLRLVKTPPIPGGHLVFARPFFKVDQWNVVRLGKRFQLSHKGAGDLAQQRR